MKVIDLAEQYIFTQTIFKAAKRKAPKELDNFQSYIHYLKYRRGITDYETPQEARQQFRQENPRHLAKVHKLPETRKAS